MVYGWLENIQFWLYPPRCVLCDAPGSRGLDLCRGCRRELPWLTAACLRCAQPLPETAPVDLCPRCLRRPAPFAAAYAPLRYQPPVDWLAVQLKFHRRLSHARLLGALIAERVASAPRPDALVPMPLHRRRWCERGYNQAGEIAAEAGRRLALPLWHAAARRIRATPSQANLPARARRANVRGAFAAAEAVSGRHLAIVDDVATTGHTAAELARTLIRAGAVRVDLWCAARA